MASAREVARQVLRRVEQGDAYASLALAGALDASGLSPADKGLATELVYGVLRHQTRLDRALKAHATRGLATLSSPALIALRVGAYQILLLRVPAHASVDDAVGAVREAAGQQVAGFANAVLRKLATDGEPPPPPATDVVRVLEEVHSFPRWLGGRLQAALGAEAIAAAEAFNRPAPVTLRVSVDRIGRNELAARIAAERPDAEIVPSTLAIDALHVRGGGAPEALQVFQEGLCTAQDAAAQLVGRLAGAAPGEAILDACAGVAGKSTHLAQLARAAGARARITAADLSRRKLDLGADTARRLGLDEITFVEADLLAADAPLEPSYDRVLLDAPCSGLGVLRRHPEAKWRTRPADITALAWLQASLLDAMAARVRPGGVLVYSVCTFTEEEGPRQIEAFLQRHPEFSPEGEAIRTWPHREEADAFYAAKLLRRA